MKNRYKVIDLFAGCGGLSYGFMEAGYEIILGIDNWNDSLETFSKNHSGAKTHLGDLATLNPDDVASIYKIKKGEIDIIVGGPPCQGFSISGRREVEDPRNGLYKSFVNFVAYYKPKAFLLENVPNLISMNGGLIKDKIIKDFENLGYKVVYKILKASDYGVPQHRKRVIFVGLLNNVEFQYPKPTHGNDLLGKLFITSKEALSDLSDETISDGNLYTSEPQSDYQKLMRKDSKKIYNHIATIHTDQTKNIISMVPDGGNYKDLPLELHSTRKVNIAWTRLNSSKPSFTIDTGHNHHFHYLFNRVPTARESARLQSFPDKFIFYGGKTSQLKQIGNAVPPILAEKIANQLKKYL